MVYDYKITCLICKKRFNPRTKTQVICSDKYCKNKRKAQKQKKKVFYFNKNCKNCGNMFQGSSSSPNQIYCSNGCQRQYYRKTYLEKVKNGQIAILKLRFEVLKRDGFSCQYCGRNPKEDKIKLNIDHIIPRKEGGKDSYENLITSCFDCNSGKRDVLLSKKDLEET